MNDSPTAVPSQSSNDWPTPEYVPAYAAWPVRRFQHRWWLHIVLLLATVLTTVMVGANHYLAFMSGFEPPKSIPDVGFLLRHGFWYAGTILLILGAHEMGHYLACRYHQIDATLPYFIPVPPFFSFMALVGTFGAFIKIREHFPNRRVLFDVGVAGPLAGFAVVVPALFFGIAMSNVAVLPPHFVGLSLGEPLLFKLASYLVWGHIPEGYSLNMHPVAFAAWFGIFATALNLMPFGQLDGGHIAYAALGDRSARISQLTVLCTIALSFFAASWVLWSVLMVLMMLAFGPRHPRPVDDALELDTARRVTALVAAIVFVVCFMPVPIEFLQL